MQENREKQRKFITYHISIYIFTILITTNRKQEWKQRKEIIGADSVEFEACF